jgi:hypothetical protein
LRPILVETAVNVTDQTILGTVPAYQPWQSG